MSFNRCQTVSSMAEINFGGISLKKVLLLVWVSSCLLLVTGGGNTISREEYLKLKRRLKSLNKPAVKTIKTKCGDIYDCVDIYKQPAFDHPLLKNHTLLRKPTFPKGLGSTSNGGSSAKEPRVPFIDCPEGTVPIQRTLMKDLLRAPSLDMFGKKYAGNSTYRGHFDQKVDIPSAHHYGILKAEYGRFYGTRVVMNVWQPKLEDPTSMFSDNQLWVVGGKVGHRNTVEVGYMVNNMLNKDQLSRLFVHWTGNNYDDGCYNLKCEGYVQVHPNMPVDAYLEPISTYDGEQYDITIMVFKDPDTKNWILTWGKNNEYWGYFPKELFPDMGEGPATRIDWGGETYNPTSLGHPPMGSGHFPFEGFKKAAYMRTIQVVNENNVLVDAPYNVVTKTDLPRCYDVDRATNYDPERGFGRYIYYGGPGGRC